MRKIEQSWDGKGGLADFEWLHFELRTTSDSDGGELVYRMRFRADEADNEQLVSTILLESYKNLRRVAESEEVPA